MTAFYHFNFNVLDLERSLAFYRQALELSVAREKEAGDGNPSSWSICGTRRTAPSCWS